MTKAICIENASIFQGLVLLVMAWYNYTFYNVTVLFPKCLNRNILRRLTCRTGLFVMMLIPLTSRAISCLALYESCFFCGRPGYLPTTSRQLIIDIKREVSVRDNFSHEHGIKTRNMFHQCTTQSTL